MTRTNRERITFFAKSVRAVGFEPTPLSRLAPKASALTTRPNSLQQNDTRGGIRTRDLLLRRETRYPLRYTGSAFRVQRGKNGFNTTLFPGGPPPQY
jgi:hypothetical protein